MSEQSAQAIDEQSAGKISVVIAAYNRAESLQNVLDDLAKQDLDADSFEIIVVDDGSRKPMAELVHFDHPGIAFQIHRQKNAGPGAARHRGIELAKGDLVVVVDDDMRLPAAFLRSHRDAHQSGLDVVLGLMKPVNKNALPLHERFHTEGLEALVRDVAAGKRELTGMGLATGNVSFRRSLYFEVGGFDGSLRQSEDRDLGIRMQLAGARFGVSEQGYSLHDSDHNDADAWLARAERYGMWDRRIASKYPDFPDADPWAFLAMVNPVSRPIFLGVVTMPAIAPPLAKAAMWTSEQLETLGVERLALHGTTFAYGVRYFQGVRAESGSLAGAMKGWREYAAKRRVSKEKAMPQGAFVKFIDSIKKDRQWMQGYRNKYHSDSITFRSYPLHLVTKIGTQMTAAIRVMHLARDLGIPLAPHVISRLIRHAYGAEIHFNADIAGGLSLVHGNGLVISHRAKIGPGVILFHNVTLGEAKHPVTGEVGAPNLEEGVHIGPGATLLGPITIGAGSKIMAGAVVTESVPPNSVVMTPKAEVVTRTARKPSAGTEPA